MIIMFIFLGLTIVFIIGTAIYLNKSKKQNGFTQNIDKKENQDVWICDLVMNYETYNIHAEYESTGTCE